MIGAIHPKSEKLIFIEVGQPNFFGGLVEKLKMENAPNSGMFRDNISSPPLP